LETPVTGGNVSLYNETLDSLGNPQPIYPTPVVGMVGLVADLTKICGQAWQNPGDIIYLLGTIPDSKISDSKSQITLGASEYLAIIHDTVAGKPPRVDFALERRVQKVCRHGITNAWIRSAHDCAEGGLAIAIAECCISASLGAEITLELANHTDQRWDEILFGEGGARILVSIPLKQQQNWESYLQENLNGYWQKIGMVGYLDSNLRISTTNNQSLVEVTIKDMHNRYFQAIERRLGAQL
jgi:phosphoribosylformylglycinamidine synthase subunit PurL